MSSHSWTALIQAMVFATPFRKLMVPVMIKSMRIDPKVLFESVKHFKFEEQFRKNIGEEEEEDLRNMQAETLIEVADIVL